MKPAIVAAALASLLAAQARAVGPDKLSPWPMKGGNPQHSSSSTLAGPMIPKFGWVYKPGTGVSPRKYYSVTMDGGGDLYIGGTERFYALTPNGTVKWTAAQQGSFQAFGQPAVSDNGVVYISSVGIALSYAAAGSGTVNYLSTAPLSSGGSIGGAGAVNIADNGNVLVAHGDESFTPASNVFPYLLNSSMTVIGPPSGNGPTSPYQRSSIAINQDSTKGCYMYNLGFGSMDCFNTSGGGDSDISVGPPETLHMANLVSPSFRGDGTWLTLFRNVSNTHCPAKASTYNGLALYTQAGSNVWRNCDLDFGTQFFRAPVSSSTTGNIYVYDETRTSIYAVDSATGGIRWTYNVGSVTDVGIMTLAAGTTIYYTSCHSSWGSVLTRLTALDAATGTKFWDVSISSYTCSAGQPVPAPNNKLYIYNGDEIISLENSNAASLSLSSITATSVVNGSQGLWVSTIAVAVKDAGGGSVSSGVPVEVYHFQTGGLGGSASIVPGATNFILTEADGVARFRVQWDLRFSDPSDYPSFVSTAGFRSPGVADGSFLLSEMRPASVSVSTGTPSLEGTQRVSTVTFTVLDSMSAPAANIPCDVVSAGQTSGSYDPSQYFWPTNGSGQASVVFRDDLAGLNNDNYSAYAVTHTVACLGRPPQTLHMNEGRVSSVVVSTGQATVEVIGSNYARVSTITVTLLDGASNPVPGVPAALDLVGSPAPVTIAPSAVAFTTATDAAGQVRFRVEEDLDGVDPLSYAGFISTFTLRLLSRPDQSIYLKEERAVTVSISTSAAVILSDMRVVTATVSVRDAAGNPLANVPIGIRSVNYGSLTTYSPFFQTNTIGKTATNALGIATFTITQDVFNITHSTYSLFGVFYPTHTVHALLSPPQTIGSHENRAASYSIAASSGIIQSDVRYATITVTVLDASSNPVPNVPVAVSSFTRAGPAAFERMAMDPARGGTGDFAATATDASGQAKFNLRLGSVGTTYDNFDDFIASATFVPMNLQTSTISFLVESNKLDHYEVQAPTQVAVGVSFVNTIIAKNKYDHKLSSYTESGINLVPLFTGTDVQGTGTLATNLTGAFTAGAFVISAQTYNRVETIDIKASRSSDGKIGRSSSVVIMGPDHFNVLVPTYSVTAGGSFPLVIQAVDAAGNQVTGYSATLALSALMASNTAQAGAGILGVTNVNLPTNGIVTISQTYTKVEDIKIRAFDSGSGIVGFSTAALSVRAGAPASLALAANPQSTIATVPSVLTSTVLDAFSNVVVEATVTYSVMSGSGTLARSLTGGTVVDGVVSTTAVTNASGQAAVFFASTNTTTSQGNLVRASINSLSSDTTVYIAVVITSAGGTLAQISDARTQISVPPNAYSFSIRVNIQNYGELQSSEVASASAAFNKSANTFIPNLAKKFAVVRDADPTVSAGAANGLVKIELPLEVTGSSQVLVGSSLTGQSLLVPLSVMRVFKLNQVSSVFEMVLDGVNLPSISSRTVSAEVKDPDGIYALGAPPSTTVSATSSGTVTTTLAAGATAEVRVPFGAFSAPTILSVTVPGASNVPAVPAATKMTGLGLTISIVTDNGLQPLRPVDIVLSYRASDVAGIDPTTLRLARYNGAAWQVLESTVDTLNRRVTGKTNHFSLFQIVSIAPQSGFDGGYVFPNPFRPALGHDRIKFAGWPPGARIKVFTISGRLLRTLDADTVGQVLVWDGTDSDGRPLPSGVYYAVVESGGSKKTAKFAVQR